MQRVSKGSLFFPIKIWSCQNKFVFDVSSSRNLTRAVGRFEVGSERVWPVCFCKKFYIVISERNSNLLRNLFVLLINSRGLNENPGWRIHVLLYFRRWRLKWNVKFFSSSLPSLDPPGVVLDRVSNFSTTHNSVKTVKIIKANNCWQCRLLKRSLTIIISNSY